jgi:hypothetical protein
MDKVLVKKEVIEPEYPVGAGAPVMVLGGRQGGKGRGKTLRERAGGLAGGVLGALGALTGQHRSLGSLVQGGISGAAQGKAIGGGLGRLSVFREGQARADIREKQKQAAAEAKAAAKQAKENRGEGLATNLLNPIGAYNRRVADREAGRFDFARQMNQEAEDYSRNMAELYRGAGKAHYNQIRRPQLRQERAEEMAAAKARGGELGAKQKKDLGMLERFREKVGVEDLEGGLAVYGSAAGGDNSENKIGVVAPSKMSSIQEATIRNTMASNNQTPPATEERYPKQQKIETAISNVLANQTPETGNPLGRFDNPAMANSPLATGGLSMSNAVAAPPTGAGTELTNVQNAANTMLSQEGMDDQRSTMDIEAAKKVMERPPISIGEYANWNDYNQQGMNPNQMAARAGEQRMDSLMASRFEDLFAPQTPQYDEYGFPVRTGEPMDLAFRLLKMITFSR